MTYDPQGTHHGSPATSPTATAGGWTASTEVLAAFGDEPSPRKASWPVVSLVAVLVLALVAGVAYAVRTLSGSGTSPGTALPAGAFLYAEIDLDPSAEQKVDGYRFLRQFPALADKLSSDDLRRTLWDGIAGDAGWADVDYATQVEPWLGQRVAIGVYDPTVSRWAARPGVAPADGSAPQPTFVLALQITDEAKAKEGLDLLAGEVRGSQGTGPAGPRPGYVLAGDYALFAETSELAEKAAAAAVGRDLSAQPSFAADMGALEEGVVRAWVDMEAASGLASLLDPVGAGIVGNLGGVTTAAGGTGRAAYVLRFDGPDAVEVAGHMSGVSALEGVESATLQGMGDLPADAAVALGLAGGEDLVDPMWSSVREQLTAIGGDPDQLAAQAQAQFGLELPGDLEALFGSNLLAVFDVARLSDGQPDAGLVGRSDHPRTEPVVTTMQSLLSQSLPGAVAETTEDGYILASTPEMLAALRDGTGPTLGEREDFRRALPDADSARMAVWVDVKPLIAGISAGFGGREQADLNLAPLAGFGMTLTSDGDQGDFRMRLVTD